ncbi:hypothetical protein TrST_g1318 [Triparma strigata]|uniref:Uncharacterized protein n=1 Tax=Triparma strigata TaxID=1606541 RepID=A0A9W7EMF4_9STRA|nr:hypothetical protein TrST_g1318 [Triparma strigata]
MSTLEERFLLLSEKLETQENATEKLSRTLEQVKAEAAESKKEVEQVKADAAESQKALETKVKQQGQTIRSQGQTIQSQGQKIESQGQTIGRQGERSSCWEGEVEGLKETSSSSRSITAVGPSEDVQTFVRSWRIVFGLGALVPHGFVLARLKTGIGGW